MFSLFLFSLLLFVSCEKDEQGIFIQETQKTVPDTDETYAGDSHSGTYDARILFVGNSLSGYNNMPAMVEEIAVAAGKNVLVGQAMFYGQALRQYVNDESLIIKIKEQPWDFVVLQSDDITAFPDMYHIEKEVLNTLKERILDNNPYTEIIYQMVWGLRDGVRIQELNGQWVTYSYEEYMDKIYTGTLYLANELDLGISPVGWTWKEIRTVHPEIELFSSDKAHPSYNGSFLTAAVHYSAIFRESCANSSFSGNLSVDKAFIMRTAASEMVLDSLERWNLQIATGIDEINKGN